MFNHIIIYNPSRNNKCSGKGHILNDPDNRRDQEGERNLFGAHLLLVRAIIHSSLIWGTVNHLEVCTHTTFNTFVQTDMP